MRTSAGAGGWLRRGAALAGAVLVVACTAGGGTPATRSRPATPLPVTAPAAVCRPPAGTEPGPHRKIVLGIVSIGDAVWPTVRVHQGWWRYWQKDGLEIWAGHQTVTITVPKAWRNRAAITWGMNAVIGRALRFPGTLASPGCPSGPGTWNGYPGGFYLRSRSACVPLVFGVGGRSAVARIGVGRSCGSFALTGSTR